MDTSLFNEPQLKAIEYDDGPSLVIAGAGSGKTRVLTYKIAHLIEKGYEPWSIMALTFTNKAANEMKERIASIVGSETARYLWMGTFHSIFLRILRTECDKIGFDSGFTIYDTADSKSLVKAIIKELHLDDKKYKPSTVLGRICDAKNQLITSKQYAANGALLASDQSSGLSAIHEIYTRYSNRCRGAMAMDFDDILLYTYYLFSLHPEVLAKYEERFKYLLVDEYQDTNYAQHQIVKQLTRNNQHICVVGDDAQSIYSFRGARIDNILTFQKLYPSTKVFKLEQNYRSTQTIVNAANSLIHKNREQIEKTVFSKNEEGDKIELVEAYSDVEEAQIVTRKIQWLHSREHLAYSDFAILYRTNAQSRIFEEQLRKQGLPYRIYGGLSFYQRKEIKDIIAYFRMAVNPSDEEALKRVINYPTRGIGTTTLAKIIDAAVVHNVSLWTVLCNPTECGLSVSSGTWTKLSDFRTLIQSFIDVAHQKNAEESGNYIIKHCGVLTDIYQDKSPENLSRQENVEELLNGLTDFCQSRQEEGDTRIALVDYLGEVSLLSDLDSDAKKEQQDEVEDDKITLMTIHSAKGLEFPAVFIVGLEEGLFPNEMCSHSSRAIEEERRLFYVAITRAMRHLFITYAKSRYHFGKMEFGNPSRFLTDIDSQYIYAKRNRIEPVSRELDLPWKRTESRSRMDSLFSTPVDVPVNSRLKKINEVTRPTMNNLTGTSSTSTPNISIQPGQHVSHDRFGEGVVLKLEGSGDSLKAHVQFNNSGVKQLLLKFAKLKVMG